MAEFRTVKAAKDFLAERIAAQAARENVPLSEVERKMLYWSEDDLTRPEATKLAEEFERDYDDTAYEQKIASLISNITADHHHQNQAEQEKWGAAVCKLSEGDHYLSVLVREAQPVGFWTSLLFDKHSVHPKHDFLRLLLTAFALIFAFFAIDVAVHRFFASKIWLSTGWDIDEREIGSVVLLTTIGTGLLGAKLWQLIRSRSSRS